MSGNQYDLERFIEAQKNDYSQALSELYHGHKESHWIWYIFPQLKQLGRSSTAIFYGIDGVEEARQYLRHPILGARLREITEALLMLDTNDPLYVMGSRIDKTKLRSSMTLFAEIEGENSIFDQVLDKYYNGIRDEYTVQLLHNAVL